MTLLVDFENVKDVNLTSLPSSCVVKIFVGRTQNNIPFALTKDAQRFGDRLEWIKIAGDGKNNLDFHLAYYLGRLTHEVQDTEFVILSKDKYFDSLIRHLVERKMSCRRISSLSELAVVEEKTSDDPNFQRAFSLLSKIEKKSRPRRRKTLTQHVSSLFQKKLPVNELQRVVDLFFSKGLVTDTKGVLSYEYFN